MLLYTAVFNHQYCYNLLTKLNNNDNNSEHACSINIVETLLKQWWTTLLVEQHYSLNYIVETILNIVRWTTLLKQYWTTLFVEQHCWNNSEQHCSLNNIVETIMNNIVRSTTLFVQQHCSFNNIVETIVNNIVRSTTLLKQWWTTLFVQHCWNNS